MQPCVCNATMHIYFNNRLDCGRWRWGRGWVGRGVLWGLHVAKPFTTRKAKNLNKADTDDEARAIKGKCCFAHSLIISRLQTVFWIQRCVRACVCCLLSSTFTGGRVHMYIHMHVYIYKLYVGVGSEYLMCLGFYHQLGQLLFLCLINGLPLAELCTELQPVCSCRFCTGCTVNTQTTLWVPLTRTHTTTGAQVLLREYETPPNSNNTASH